MATQYMILLVGMQGSTKSSYTKKHLLKRYPDAVIISRDVIGGTVAQCMKAVKDAMKTRQSVIVDNTNATRAVRAPYIALAREYGATVNAVYMDTTMEHCQIRVLQRMWDCCGKICMDGVATPDISQEARDAAHIFPPMALFKFRKILEEPEFHEGFDEIVVKRVGAPRWSGTGKALFLDIDGTVRATEHLPNKYPTCPKEVSLLHDAVAMRRQLNGWIADGYKIIGVSNQSGIAKGTVFLKDVEACFQATCALLEMDFPILYCPHRSAPVSCYCRKPQSGMFVQACMQWGIDPAQSVMVGDMTTDKTAAARMGIKYIDVADFWKI